MPSLSVVVSNLIKPHQTKLTVGFIVIILMLATIWFYNNIYAQSKYNVFSADKNMSDLPNAGSNSAVEMHMYHVSWCPYCKKALPVFDSVKEKYQNQPVNGHKIVFMERDITDQKSGSEDANINKGIVEKYKITSYPTIFIITTSGNRVDFKAKVTNENLDNFLLTAAK